MFLQSVIVQVMFLQSVMVQAVFAYYTAYICTLSVLLVIIYFYFPDEISLMFREGMRGDCKNAARDLESAGKDTLERKSSEKDGESNDEWTENKA
ncbi:hypothetical protein CspHIS471_0207360 [Cutaneotrichosporon sp. HIS471]|nr:hypothetical protein CspHIS471_0207360 [Cutaneotrichosporon sp. HIS471]